MDKSQYGVHRTHCCVIHGCKYGNEDCPVINKEIKQEYLCEWCDEDGINTLDELFDKINSITLNPKDIERLQSLLKYSQEAIEYWFDNVDCDDKTREENNTYQEECKYFLEKLKIQTL